MSQLVARTATAKVPPGVDYTGIFRTPTASVPQGLLGVTLGLLTFTLAAPLVISALAGAYWLAVGRPGDFADTYRALVAYEIPFGLAAYQLGLAVLIPLAVGLTLFLHRVRPGLLSSVLGRLRWRWFAATFGVAVVTLAIILATQRLAGVDAAAWVLNPQQGWWAFVLVMLLTTPLQAAAEEYFFRGYLMAALGSMVRAPWFGIVTSAALFTAFHASGNAAIVADRFAFGLLAGWLVWRTGGLEAAIAAHVVNNIASFTIAALTSSMAQIKATTEVTWEIAAWDVTRFGLFTLAVWLLARRWQPERLTPVPAPTPKREARRGRPV